MSTEPEPRQRECVTHHHACDCRERAFREALAVAQDTMEYYATSDVLEEWHCRVDDLTGTAYPAGVTSGIDRMTDTALAEWAKKAHAAFSALVEEYEDRKAQLSSY